MILGLTGGEWALGAVGAAFVVFALVVAMVVPRSRPSFPGDRVGLFVLASLVAFAIMVTTVVLTAGGGEHAEEAVATETGGSGETGPGETETEPTESEPTQTETGGGTTGAAGGGDAAAGETVFASAGCGGCHTLSEAGSSGTTGPNLDETKPSEDKVVERVTEGKGAMPSFRDQLSEQEILDVAAFVSQSAGGE